MPGYRKSKGGDYLTSFQTRIGSRNDLGTWTYNPTWTTISNDWNGIEVEYLRGTNSGEMRLWVNGVLAQTLTVLDTDTIAIDAVQLGMMGVDNGTRGTIYLDDFTSTRFSTIGMLPDPGVHENLPIVHTYTSQPDAATGVDTFITSSGSTSNYGTIDYMWVGYSSDTNGKYRSLIKFNLASIPANATITSATLILRLNYQGGTTSNTMSVYPLLKNWTESGVTWNRYDGTNNWQTAGAGGTTDRDTTSMGSRGFVSSEPVGFKAIPLDVSTVQNYVNGTRANYGWLLKMDTESGFLYEFTTSDRYIVANRPQLVVEYTLPEEEPDWVNKAYTYEDADHIHAVTSLVVTDENNNQTTNAYRYDENGNMTCRIEGGETFLQAYNAENRMSGMLLVSGDCDTLGDTLKAWQFTYDGDGVKVKQEFTDSIGTITTYYYAGGSYEVQTDGTTETVRQYYAIAGVTVGMRAGETFYYFLTDHLGSVVGVTDNTGTLVSETRYLPFGEIRTDVGTISQTDYGYTFQRNVNGMGLMDYKARYFSTLLGRFTQPDTIIPGAGNPQAFNRYAYTTNNPINYIDPSGKTQIEDDRISCQTKKCLEDDYYFGKDEEDYYLQLLGKEESITTFSTESNSWYIPKFSATIDTTKFGVGGLDYGFLEENQTTNKNNNIVGPAKTFYDSGDYSKWWKPVPLVSTVLTAFDQMIQDKEKGYPVDTQLTRILISMSEDAVTDAIALPNGAGVGALTIESGPFSVLFGIAVYYQSNMFLTQAFETLNDAVIFPTLDLN